VPDVVIVFPFQDWLFRLQGCLCVLIKSTANRTARHLGAFLNYIMGCVLLVSCVIVFFHQLNTPVWQIANALAVYLLQRLLLNCCSHLSQMILQT